MTLVVPAWKGWEVIDLFYEHARTSNFRGMELSHRAALIFCQHNTPILRVGKLADELLSQTKTDIVARIDQLIDPESERVDRKKLTSHRYGDALHYLNLSSFDLLQGSLERFVARYYKNVPYHQLLLYTATMPAWRPHLKTLRRNIARQKVFQIIDIIQADKATDGAATIEDVKTQALSLLPADIRMQTEQAMDAMAGSGSALWYILIDLWDYIPKWEANG